MRRFRLRRVFRVNSEALLIVAGQNLKRRLEKTGVGTASIPSGSRLCFLFDRFLVADSFFVRHTLPVRQTDVGLKHPYRAAHT